MSYADALADLKADFGKKKLLTPGEIAPYISKSPSAQASMRTRKQFPIAKKDMGGRVVVSIYALAKYIGEDDASPDAVEQIRVSKPAKPVAKTAKGIDKTKPYRRPPSLGKTLTALRKRVIDTALQLHFQQTLFAELEAIAMDQVLAPGRTKKFRLTSR